MRRNRYANTGTLTTSSAVGNDNTAKLNSPLTSESSAAVNAPAAAKRLMVINAYSRPIGLSTFTTGMGFGMLVASALGAGVATTGGVGGWYTGVAGTTGCGGVGVTVAGATNEAAPG